MLVLVLNTSMVLVNFTVNTLTERRPGVWSWKVRKFDGKNLDVYSSVNLIAFERQLEALQKVASAPDSDR